MQSGGCLASLWDKSRHPCGIQHGTLPGCHKWCHGKDQHSSCFCISCLRDNRYLPGIHLKQLNFVVLKDWNAWGKIDSTFKKEDTPFRITKLTRIAFFMWISCRIWRALADRDMSFSFTDGIPPTWVRITRIQALILDASSVVWTFLIILTLSTFNCGK